MFFIIKTAPSSGQAIYCIVDFFKKKIINKGACRFSKQTEKFAHLSMFIYFFLIEALFGNKSRTGDIRGPLTGYFDVHHKDC